MVTEDREMLAKELSSRLPYGVMVSIEQYDGTTIQRKLIAVCYKGLESSLYVDGVEGFMVEEIANVKPYLRPLSDMTQEESEEYEDLKMDIRDKLRDWKCYKLIQWCNAHYIDYNNLIGQGVALIAPKGMYKIPKRRELPY